MLPDWLRADIYTLGGETLKAYMETLSAYDDSILLGLHRGTQT